MDIYLQYLLCIFDLQPLPTPTPHTEYIHLLSEEVSPVKCICVFVYLCICVIEYLSIQPDTVLSGADRL